jgi:muconolactone delta-isomerase
MLFHLDFHVEYGPDMTQEELFSTWAREAEVALGAKQAGVVVNLWKCVGERRVIAVVDVESHDMLDEILLTLPIMVEMGQHVDVKVTALRRYEDFASTVNRLLNSGGSASESSGQG